ncbi:MAG TPA: sigma-70 family RNA polymerase sigma factor [Planctomycetota bacterium]|nr:sigma-70 family RNA polymerase sigma factor [Planctomycetota bacterium]
MTVEQSFRRYREHGDVKALGAVFDAVAQELALVAAHLAPAGVDAEDLVQATFLAAIEHRERWDPARALLPWLIGILTNQVRRERQRTRRPRPACTDPVVPDPLDVVESQEVGERIAAALRGLPRQYRQALTLRLLHGLQPAQIATALGCPVATCKTRLQRGLEMLRRTLPAGIAPAFAFVLASGRGLASCREVVLGKAAAGVAVASAASTTVVAGVLMKKTLTVAALLGMLATAAALWSPGSAPNTPPAAPRPAGELVAATPAATARDADLERAPIATVAQPARTDETPTLHGRVVDEAGTALPDVLVALGRTSPDGEFASAEMFLMYRALNPGEPGLPRDRLRRTDAQGRFAFDAMLRGQGSVLAAWSPTRGVAFLPLAADTDGTPQVLVLPDHAQLYGRVTGADGQPVPNVYLNVYPDRSGMPAATARTDAEGNYRTVPLPAAAYRIYGDSPAHASTEATAALGTGDVRVDLEMPLLPVLSALLVDAQQVAWTGVRIENTCGIDVARLAVLATRESIERRAAAGRGGRNEEALRYDPATGRVQGPIRDSEVAFLSLWWSEARLAEVPLQSLDERSIELQLTAPAMQTLRVHVTFAPHPATPVQTTVRLDRPAGRLAVQFATQAEFTFSGSEASLTVPAAEVPTAWWLSVASEGYTPYDQPLVWPARTPLLVRDVALERTTRIIAGVVVGPDAAPLESATVLVLSADGTFVGRRTRVSASTDRDGRFHVDDLPDRALRLLVDADERGMAAVEVPRDAAMPLRVVAARPRSLEVRGADGEGTHLRVLDADGAPLVDDRLRGCTRYGATTLRLWVAGQPQRIEGYLPGSPLPYAAGDRAGDGDTFVLMPIAR